MRTEHIRLDAFKWIVLGGGNLLECRRMHYRIDSLERPIQTIAIPDVADKEPDLWVAVSGVFLRHFELLEFVSGKDDEAPNLWVSLEHCPDKRLAK
ncbi:MAG: hypothetical protein R3F11_07935 [Verrucomicrobiales bacterium]